MLTNPKQEFIIWVLVKLGKSILLSFDIKSQVGDAFEKLLNFS